MLKKRINYIDMVKGIGILFVVLGHFEFILSYFNIWLSSFHMPLFFIISGILISNSGGVSARIGDFIAGKARSIMITYGIFSFVSIVASIVLDGSLIPQLLQTFSFNGIAVLWFLPALFFGEVCFFLIKKNTSSKMSFIIIILTGGMSIFANELFQRYFIHADNYLNIFTGYLIAVMIRTGIAVTFLAIGYYLYEFLEKEKHHKGIYLLTMVICLVINIFSTCKNGSVDLNNLVFGNYFLYFVGAISGSVFIICLCKLLPNIPLLSFIGKNSLIIMVTHINCRFMGVSYRIGRYTVSLFPDLGQIGYIVTVVILMIAFEAIAIFVINRYMPFMIGRKLKKE